nr:uncharacterized protein LOC105873719 isoform X1 [Microcebus murinus]
MHFVTQRYRRQAALLICPMVTATIPEVSSPCEEQQKMTKSQIEQKCPVTGIRVIQGCDCGLHSGGVAAAGLCSKKPIQGCDAGELYQPYFNADSFSNRLNQGKERNSEPEDKALELTQSFKEVEKAEQSETYGIV